MTAKAPELATIAGLVLAGGRSRRFGAEKAAALFEGRPLLDWSLRTLSTAGAPLAVNAAADSAAAELARIRGLAVVPDLPGDPDGPLAGVRAGLAWARAQGAAWLATLPCDTPGLPADLVPRLLQGARPGLGARAATDDGRHPLCALWSTTLLEALERALADGHPPVWAFQDQAGMGEVRFGDAAAFANLNAPPHRA